MKRASVGRALAVLSSLALGSAYVAFKSRGHGTVPKPEPTLTPTSVVPSQDSQSPTYLEGSKSGRIFTPPVKDNTTMSGSKIGILIEPEDVKKPGEPKR